MREVLRMERLKVLETIGYSDLAIKFRLEGSVTRLLPFPSERNNKRGKEDTETATEGLASERASERNKIEAATAFC